MMVTVRVETNAPTSELHYYDKEVAGDYDIKIADGMPRDEIAEAALDVFHDTIPIKILDYFWIEVILPGEVAA